MIKSNLCESVNYCFGFHVSSESIAAIIRQRAGADRPQVAPFKLPQVAQVIIGNNEPIIAYCRPSNNTIADSGYAGASFRIDSDRCYGGDGPRRSSRRSLRALWHMPTLWLLIAPPNRQSIASAKRIGRSSEESRRSQFGLRQFGSSRGTHDPSDPAHKTALRVIAVVLSRLQDNPFGNDCPGPSPLVPRRRHHALLSAARRDRSRPVRPGSPAPAPYCRSHNPVGGLP